MEERRIAASDCQTANPCLVSRNRPMRYLVPLLMLAFCWSVPGGASLRAAEEDLDQPAARKAVQQGLRHRLPAKRAEAFRMLKDYPPLEAAKLLVQSGLADHQPEVRRAAYETLKPFGANEEVAEFLFKSLEKQTGLDKRARGQTESTAAAPLIAVLLSSKSKTIAEQLRDLLNQWVARSKSNAAALISVADELGTEADETALRSLWKLTKLKCFSDLFAFRRAVVQGMIRVRQPATVGALIQLLPGVQGEVRGDIVRYLTKVTGEPHGVRAEAWQAWWKDHKDDFVMRADDAKPGAVAQFPAAQFPAAADAAVGSAPASSGGGWDALVLWYVDLRPADGVYRRYLGKHAGAADHGRQARTAERGITPCPTIANSPSWLSTKWSWYGDRTWFVPPRQTNRTPCGLLPL